MSTLAKTIKANILRILEERDISKNELSRRSGMTQPAVIKLLNHDNELLTDTVQRIADALDVEITELVIDHEAKIESTGRPHRRAVPAA